MTEICFELDKRLRHLVQSRKTIALLKDTIGEQSIKDHIFSDIIFTEHIIARGFRTLRLTNFKNKGRFLLRVTIFCNIAHIQVSDTVLTTQMLGFDPYPPDYYGLKRLFQTDF